MATLKVCTTFFAGGRCFAKGQAVESDDPIVAGREHLFESADAERSNVEQATAAPGEKRTTRRPAKRAPKS